MSILSNNIITNTSYCSIFGNKLLSYGIHTYKFLIVYYTGISHLLHSFINEYCHDFGKKFGLVMISSASLILDIEISE